MLISASRRNAPPCRIAANQVNEICNDVWAKFAKAGREIERDARDLLGGALGQRME